MIGPSLSTIYPKRRRGSGSPTPWYLAGHVNPSNIVAAYKPKSASSLADSYINIANPGTYDISAISAPSWNATVGWVLDGAANSLNTGILHSDSGQSWSAVVRFSNASNAGFLLGDASTNTSHFAIVPNSSGRRRYQNSGSLQVNSGAVTSGVMTIAGGAGYYNGVSDGSITSNTQVTRHILIGSGNSGNSSTPAPMAFCACEIQAVAIYNTPISAGQALAIYNAIIGL